MKEKTILAVLIFLIILCIVGAYMLFVAPKGSTPQVSNTLEINNTKCGDGVCEADETCKSCPADCSCKSGEFCDSTSGICKLDVCGNGICTEKKRYSCCQDCGCPDGKICSRVSGTCLDTSNMSNEKLNQVISDYLSKNSINATPIKIQDTYFSNIAVKQVTLNCSIPNSQYTCEIILMVDENGTIIKNVQTT